MLAYKVTQVTEELIRRLSRIAYLDLEFQIVVQAFYQSGLAVYKLSHCHQLWTRNCTIEFHNPQKMQLKRDKRNPRVVLGDRREATVVRREGTVARSEGTVVRREGTVAKGEGIVARDNLQGHRSECQESGDLSAASSAEEEDKEVAESEGSPAPSDPDGDDGDDQEEQPFAEEGKYRCFQWAHFDSHSHHRALKAEEE